MMRGVVDSERDRRRALIARALRNELGMSKDSIAQYMGLHRTSVGNLLRHGKTTSSARLKKSVSRTHKTWAFKF